MAGMRVCVCAMLWCLVTWLSSMHARGHTFCCFYVFVLTHTHVYLQVNGTRRAASLSAVLSVDTSTVANYTIQVNISNTVGWVVSGTARVSVLPAPTLPPSNTSRMHSTQLPCMLSRPSQTHDVHWLNCHCLFGFACLLDLP